MEHPPRSGFAKQKARAADGALSMKWLHEVQKPVRLMEHSCQRARTYRPKVEAKRRMSVRTEFENITNISRDRAVW